VHFYFARKPHVRLAGSEVTLNSAVVKITTAQSICTNIKLV
jgi:hypothetical protein